MEWREATDSEAESVFAKGKVTVGTGRPTIQLLPIQCSRGRPTFESNDRNADVAMKNSHVFVSNGKLFPARVNEDTGVVEVAITS